MTKKSWLWLSLCLMVSLIAAPVLALPMTVNINSADVETLTSQLKGIGPGKAAEIVKYREKFGPFREVEDIVLVKGIGWKTMEANREVIRLRDDDSALSADGDAAKQMNSGKDASTSDGMKADPS